jgi:AraC-like DNA-binding protein
MERRMISRGFVDDAVEFMIGQGLEPAPALVEAGIQLSGSEPVSNEQYGQMWLGFAALAQDEFFGLGGRPMRPGSFRMLCYAVLHVGTLERALKRALKFLDIVLDDPTGDLRQHDGNAEIILTDHHSHREAFAYRTYWILLLGVLCWLVGRRIPLRHVDFPCPAPENRSDYLAFFGAPVRFDQPCSRLVFSAAYLSLPIIRDEKALRAFLRGAPANILLRYRHDGGISVRIRSHLRALPVGDWPSFDAIATEMKLSPATLRRRLRSEGQSFAAIRDEIRYVQAQALLREKDARVAEIATRLGYAEPGAFHRAFKNWSGVTPSTFRDTA